MLSGTFSVTPILGVPPWDTTYNGTNPFTWTFGGVTRAQITAAHGLATFGGGGTDYKTVVGPMPGFEAADSGIWFLAPATVPSSSNVGVYGNGTGTIINTQVAGGMIGFLDGGANYIAQFDSTSFRFYATGGQLRASITPAHGVGTFGGGGTDFAAAIGPLVGFENANAAVWLLPNGIAPTSGNCALYADTSHTFINSRLAGGIVSVSHAGGGAVASWDGSAALYTSSYDVAIGASPAASGTVRVPNNVVALAANRNGGGADLAIAAITNGDKLYLGGNLTGAQAVAAIVLWTAGGYALGWGNTGGSGALAFETANGIITASTTFGIDVRSGARTGVGSFRPHLALALNGTGAENMVELCEVVLTERKLSLCLFANLGAAAVPAGSGDGVIYLANATTAPSAGISPTGGGILYAEAGALKWLGTAGTITTIAAA